MKNLKKVLALVMAFATAFTVMASAAFTDAADIEAGTAVDMLSALGVIKGYEDGSFKPDGTVTRAEMAKMIFTIRSGGNDNADSYASTSSTFTDINGHWAAGYIKYCQSMGIIAGKSATTFDPDGLVTGVEAAKMMLVTMGYNADKAGLVGTTWSSKTLGYANENGLLDDVNAPLEQGLPRQYAAQLLYNGLDADTVTYDADSASFKKIESTGLEKRETSSGQYQWVSITKNETVGKKFLKLDTIENEQIDKVEKEDGKETFSINNGAYTKVKVDYSSLMGQKVKVMIKDNDTSKVYGIYADDDSKVIAAGSVGTLDTVSDTAKVKLDGTEYKLDSAISSMVITYTNGVTVPTDRDTLSELVSLKNTYPSYSIKMIDNGANGKIDRIIVTPNSVAKVTYVGSSSITAGTTYKFDDADIYEGVAKNDWAVITAGDFTVTGDPVLTKADTISGEVTGVKSGSPIQIQVNDTWYKLMSGVSTPSVGDKVDLVVVGKFVYDADTASGTSKDILLITANEEADNDLNTDYTVDARAYFTDGTNKKITISKLNGKDVVDSAGTSTASVTAIDDDDLANVMFTYSVNKDGNYEIKELANAAATTSVINPAMTIAKNTVGYDTYAGAYSTGTGYASKKIAGQSIKDDAVIFVRASGEIKVLTGKTVKDWSVVANTVTAMGALIDEDNGIDYVKVATLVYTGASVPGADGDKLYAYLTGDSYETKKDGDTVTAFPVWTGSTTDTLYEDGNTNVGLAAGTVIVYTVDGSEIDFKSNLTAAAGDAYAIKGINAVEEGTVSLIDSNGATSSYDMDEDCVYIKVDDDNTKGVEGNTVDAVTLAAVENGVYKLNAYVAFDSSTPKKILAIIFDQDGALDLTGYTSATAPTGMALTAVDGSAADTLTTGITYAAGTTSYTAAANNATTKLNLAVTQAAGTTVSITSKIGSAAATTYTSGDDLAVAAGNTVVFTVTVSQANHVNVVYTVTVNVAA